MEGWAELAAPDAVCWREWFRNSPPWWLAGGRSMTSAARGFSSEQHSGPLSVRSFQKAMNSGCTS